MNEEEQKDFKKRVKNVEADLTESLKKNGLELELGIEFPRYREVPKAVKLAMEVFVEHGGTVVKNYSLSKELDKKDLKP